MLEIASINILIYQTMILSNAKIFVKLKSKTIQHHRVILILLYVLLAISLGILFVLFSF